jgi:hypothetical protein
VLIARLALAVSVVLVAVAQPAGADATGVTPTATLDCTNPLGAGAA